MQLLRFAHQFFHFSSAAWLKFTAAHGAGEAALEHLFRHPVFPRRQLKQGAFHSLSQAREFMKSVLEQEAAKGIRTISESMSEYPAAISAYIPPERRPPLLYLRGASVPAEGNLVAVVGTRSPSTAGIQATGEFCAYFQALGIQVISGLALGIDAIAHKNSLTHGTTAVLGGEVDQVYPQEHLRLSEEILEKGGTLLSSFPLGQVPLPQNFPIRNELIAALAAGVVVVEGNEKSGAAITGRFGLAMSKGVVALTQDFRSAFGRGAIQLQRDGAVLVTCVEEAGEALFQRLGGLPCARPLFPREKRRATFTFNDFQSATGASTPDAIALLEEGILKGRIEKIGNRYRLRGSPPANA